MPARSAARATAPALEIDREPTRDARAPASSSRVAAIAGRAHDLALDDALPASAVAQGHAQDRRRGRSDRRSRRAPTRRAPGRPGASDASSAPANPQLITRRAALLGDRLRRASADADARATTRPSPSGRATSRGLRPRACATLRSSVAARPGSGRCVPQSTHDRGRRAARACPPALPDLAAPSPRCPRRSARCRRCRRSEPQSRAAVAHRTARRDGAAIVDEADDPRAVAARERDVAAIVERALDELGRRCRRS